MKAIFSILFCLVLSSCMIQEKAKPRDSHEPMPTPASGKSQADMKLSIDQFRSSGGLGLYMVSKNCSESKSVIVDAAVKVLTGCKETFILRLKLKCKLGIGIPEPLMHSLRYKEVEVQAISGPVAFKSFFPKTLSTNNDGIVETSFSLSEPLETFKLSILRNRESVEVSEDLMKYPIALSEGQCADKKL